MMTFYPIFETTATIAVSMPQYDDITHSDIFATIESVNNYEEGLEPSPPVK